MIDRALAGGEGQRRMVAMRAWIWSAVAWAKNGAVDTLVA